MELFNYFRSSASYRVRIALALKGLDYDYRAVHLAKNEHMEASFASVSAARLVPLLHDGGHVLTQSLAIIEYLDETHPEPPLLPGAPADRAWVRALAMDIACEIHPLNNLRVLRYLVHNLKLSEDDKNRWYRHWVESGLEAVSGSLPRARRSTATVMPPRWPTACWCRRSSTPSASTAGSTMCPPSCGCSRPAWRCRPSRPPSRPAARTPTLDASPGAINGRRWRAAGVLVAAAVQFAEGRCAHDQPARRRQRRAFRQPEPAPRSGR
jgi:maleylacetoacetate isomerase/maleylpyruvate isomerase